LDYLEDPGGGLKNARGHFDLLKRGLWNYGSPLISGQDGKGIFELWGKEVWLKDIQRRSLFKNNSSF